MPPPDTVSFCSPSTRMKPRGVHWSCAARAGAKTATILTTGYRQRASCAGRDLRGCLDRRLMNDLPYRQAFERIRAE